MPRSVIPAMHASRPVSCALGQIVYAGTKWNSRATYAHAPPPLYQRPTPHHLLVYTLEGEADYVDSTGVQAVLRPGTLVWAAKGVEQSYGPRPGSRWSEFFVWFGGPSFDAWQAHGLPGQRTRILRFGPVGYAMGRFREAVLPADGAGQRGAVLCLVRLQQIIAEALQGEDEGVDARWRADACRWLGGGDLRVPSLVEVARAMNASYSSFRKRFLLLTGTTPARYRRQEVIRRACVRLRETEDDLALIANDLGFHDAFHLSRAFKSELGMPPSRFRQQVASSPTHSR